MKKWNLIIDIEKCENCNNCFLACKDEHVDNEFSGYSALQPKHGHHWINIHKKERGQYPFIDVAYLPVTCFHCDDAPCVKAAEDGAVYKRDDGIVIIDPEKAKGQKKIVDSCPHNSIWWNESENLAQKCTLCAHLLDDNWKEPRCVNACPTGALRIVKNEDRKMEDLVKEGGLLCYPRENNTRPRVHYKNLHRFSESFIGGSVAVTKNNISDCVGSAEVILQDQSGQDIARQVTDYFGDFKFDGLENHSGKYLIRISHPDHAEKSIEINLEESTYIGIIYL